MTDDDHDDDDTDTTDDNNDDVYRYEHPFRKKRPNKCVREDIKV